MPISPPSSDSRSASRRNLLRLCWLRTILLAGLALAAVLVQWLDAIPLLRDDGVLLAIGGLTLINIVTVLRLRGRSAVADAELFLQLVADVLLVTLALYRTGGSTNPFISYYLVPLTIASAILSLRYALALALVTLAGYTVLLVYYQPLALFSHHMIMQDGSMMMDDSGFNTHVLGMWVDFLLSATLITFFVSRMSRALREQDRLLAEQHERLLQKEQVVALGALAAGAAHELGTPLATMTLLTQEMEASLPAGADALGEDLTLLREQLQVCRSILGKLRQQAMNPVAAAIQTVAVFGQTLRDKMIVIHPGRQFRLVQGAGSGMEFRPTAMLEQVAINLLNNAAEASRVEVVMTLAVVNGEFRLDIHDDGPGIDPDVAKRLGEPFVSSKPEGLGIGFFLSHASINPLGGSIHLQNAEGGGTDTALRLPLTSLVTP